MRHTIDASSSGADGVRLLDVDRDGRLDVTTGWEEGGAVRVYLHPGAARARDPWPAVTVGAVSSPEDAVFVDLDGDGSTDVVSATEGTDRTMYVHWAPADGTRRLDPGAWTTAAIPATQGLQQWMFALPLDVDRAHGIDLVTGSKEAGAAVGWLEAPASPRDLAGWVWHPLLSAGWIMSLLPRDLDGDGDVDLVVTDRKGPRRGCLWLENAGAAGWLEHRIGAVDADEVMFATVADVDSDGRDDVVVAVRGGPIQLHRRTADASPTFETHLIDLPPGVGTGKAVAVGDLDGDGRQDLAFTCESADGALSGLRWLSPGVDPTARAWRDHEIAGPEGVKFDLVELLDVDADGDLDALTTEERDLLGVVWYENPLR